MGGVNIAFLKFNIKCLRGGACGLNVVTKSEFSALRAFFGKLAQGFFYPFSGVTFIKWKLRATLHIS